MNARDGVWYPRARSIPGLDGSVIKALSTDSRSVLAVRGRDVTTERR